MSHLVLTLLGSFDATLDGQPIVGLTSRRARALLAYLAIEHERPHHRDLLAALLWPDLPEREAARKFRYTLSDLRQALGEPFLLISRNTIQFNSASSYDLDVATFEKHVAGIQSLYSQLCGAANGRNGNQPPDLGILTAAVHWLNPVGSFLQDLFIDSTDFDDWALVKRQQIHWQLMSVLQQLGAIYELRGEYRQMQAYARRQIELQPWREEAHRQLMRALALNGERSMALVQYQVCLRALEAEFGAGPEEQTHELHRAIRDGRLPGRSVRQDERVSVSPRSRSPEYQQPRAIFVERGAELARLNRMLGAALAGQGCVAFVTGEAGSGKTTLMAEFARRALAEHSDLLVASGQCHAHTGIGDPYLPFREIMQMLAGGYEARQVAYTFASELGERLDLAGPTFVQDVMHYGPDLVGSFVPQPMIRLASPETLGFAAGQPSTATLRPIHANQPNQQVAAVLLALARRQPLILLLDDLHWADYDSINLLSYLGRHLAGSRILVLASYQSALVAQRHTFAATTWRAAAVGGPAPGAIEQHPLEVVVQELQRRFGDIRVDLDQADGRQLVDSLIQSEPNCLSIAFHETLYRYTAGNPLFVVALLNSMKANGSLVRDVLGRWVEGPALNWKTLPPQVEAAIAGCVGHLPQAWQTILAIASVEGEAFTAEVVARVCGLEVAELMGALRREHGLVYNDGMERAGPLGGQWLSHYRFRHRLAQQYLYNQLDLAERARLHEAISQAQTALYTAIPAVS